MKVQIVGVVGVRHNAVIFICSFVSLYARPFWNLALWQMRFPMRRELVSEPEVPRRVRPGQM